MKMRPVLVTISSGLQPILVFRDRLAVMPSGNTRNSATSLEVSLEYQVSSLTELFYRENQGRLAKIGVYFKFELPDLEI